jgi:hypothetical protein
LAAPRPATPEPARRGGGLFPSGSLAPDRRGEAFAIFSTIFLRPALELRAPIRRFLGDLASARPCTRMGARLIPARPIPTPH